MISNYLKLAWRVLGRKKFFTFISLFGISFTLASLMLFTAIFQTELSDDAPMGNADDLVYVPMLTLSKQYYDTIPTVDSTLVAGIMTYDTTFVTKKSGRSTSNSDFSKQMLLNHFSDIPSASQTAIVNIASYDVFVNNNKLHVEAVYANVDYWSVFNFNFLEGRSFDQSETEKNNPVLVMTEDFAFKYFGERSNIVGRTMEMDGKNYAVIGLVETPKVSKAMGYSVSRDVFVPYSLLPEGYTEDYYFGGFHAAFQKNKGATIEQLKEELQFAATQIPLDHPDNEDNYNEAIVRPGTIRESLAQQIYYEEEPSTSLTILSTIIISLLALFILLPMLNLINLNVSRIMDRAAEIGVRKAFGADKATILSQFVFENVVLTLLGGFIALILAGIAIYLLNQSQLLGHTVLAFDVKFFISSLFICLLFGILSGVIPAYKMSKLNIVDALKQNKI